MGSQLKWTKVLSFASGMQQPYLPGTVHRIDVGGKRLALIFTGNSWHAMNDTCPHAGAHFSDGGWCDDGNVICPFHRHRFNLQTGRGTRGDYVEVYPVELREDGVWVGMKPRWPFWLRRS